MGAAGARSGSRPWTPAVRWLTPLAPRGPAILGIILVRLVLAAAFLHTRPARGIHTINLPAGQDTRQDLRAPRNLEQAMSTGGGTMVTVELTKREADALSEATRLGDTDDLEALRTAIDKLWKAADAQQRGDTWRIIGAT